MQQWGPVKERRHGRKGEWSGGKRHGSEIREREEMLLVGGPGVLYGMVKGCSYDVLS
jgi:hypothetical protein